MEQGDVAGKILLELFELKIATEENENILYKYLMQAYGAGYDEGRLQYHKRKLVAQYSTNGKLIKIWNSISAAARKYNLTKSAISKAAHGINTTAAGFQWKFVNLKKPISSETETIGTAQEKSKSILPKQRNHSSKKV